MHKLLLKRLNNYMKRIWIVVVAVLGTLALHAQDDRYYQNNNGGSDDVYTGDTYTEEQLDQPAASYETFYNDLQPYGNWVQSSSYGYVWVPGQAGAGFEPYVTGGHWEYTAYGWTWVSDYTWGWATFHYGRWYMDPAYGWVWVPGSLWAPAWVAWGQYEGYYCWAPLWPGEYTSTHYGSREHQWHFTQQNHLTDHNIADQIVNNTVVNHTGGSIEPHIIQIGHVSTLDKSVFFAGPKLKEVEKQTGRSIQRMDITAAPAPAPTRVDNSTVSIYRPVIRPVARPAETPSSGAAPATIQRGTIVTSGPQQSPPQSSPQREQPVRGQEWSAPRQSPAPVQIQRTEPAYQRAEPVQRPVQTGVAIPATRPAPAPQQQIRIEAPALRAAPAPAHLSGSPRR